MIEESRRRWGRSVLPLTVNLVNPGVAAVVISIPFDRQNADDSREARRFSLGLLKACSGEGFIAYRLGLEDAGQLEPMDASRRQVLQNLESCLNRDGIVAPSRYRFIWTAETSTAVLPAEKDSLEFACAREGV